MFVRCVWFTIRPWCEFGSLFEAGCDLPEEANPCPFFSVEVWQPSNSSAGHLRWNSAGACSTIHWKRFVSLNKFDADWCAHNAHLSFAALLERITVQDMGARFLIIFHTGLLGSGTSGLDVNFYSMFSSCPARLWPSSSHCWRICAVWWPIRSEISWNFHGPDKLIHAFLLRGT